VRARHAANLDRFDPRPVSQGGKGDTLQLEPGTREYGEARILEDELADTYKTVKTNKPKTYRCNRQRPLAGSKAAEYEEYLKMKKSCG
jgi:hypothetical protein